MTLKTSFFNKGIYKSTIRRYAWGSMLYFAILFLITGMVILLTANPERIERYYGERQLILSSDYMIFPMLLSMVVPTVTGLLIFRFVHSKKASVFIHSLPVSREANYISSVLAAFTLMAFPVILNSAVLMIISLSGYGKLFSVGACLVWMLLNLLSLFIMFSCTCLAAVITGNSFAVVVINILAHTFVLILSAGFLKLASLFLHGFSQEYTFVDVILKNTFPVRLSEIMTMWGYSERPFEQYGVSIAKFTGISVLFYILSGFLYKKRRMETVEDVAGFSCLNIIFKYALTFMAFLGAYSLLCGVTEGNLAILWCMVIITAAIIYFGAEMLLKKTFRVWRSYKGFAVILAVFAAVICVFKFTAFFGYETRIPETEDIQAVSLYEYYNDEKPVFEDAGIVQMVKEIHSEMISDKDEKEEHSAIHIEYLLKNGKIMHRRYRIDEKIHKVMNRMYENLEFKKANERIFRPMDEIYKIRVRGQSSSEEITAAEKKVELISCIKEDVGKLSYSHIHSDAWSFGIEIEYAAYKGSLTPSKTYPTITDSEGKRVQYIYISINPSFEKTVKWIKENGYWDIVKIKNAKALYIARDRSELPFFDDEGRLLEKEDPEKLKKIIKITEKEHMENIFDYVQSTGHGFIPKEEAYYIFMVDDTAAKDYAILSVITEEEVKELKIYP